jgi:protease-4
VFDGRVLTGEQAFSAGLVDQVGYLDDAVEVARQMAGLPLGAPVVMLRRDNDRAYTLLDVTPNTPTMSSILPLKIPGLDRSQMPNFLYLWQPEPTMVSGL